MRKKVDNARLFDGSFAEWARAKMPVEK